MGVAAAFKFTYLVAPHKSPSLGWGTSGTRTWAQHGELAKREEDDLEGVRESAQVGYKLVASMW